MKGGALGWVGEGSLLNSEINILTSFSLSVPVCQVGSVETTLECNCFKKLWFIFSNNWILLK